MCGINAGVYLWLCCIDFNNFFLNHSDFNSVVGVHHAAFQNVTPTITIMQYHLRQLFQNSRATKVPTSSSSSFFFFFFFTFADQARDL